MLTNVEIQTRISTLMREKSSCERTLNSYKTSLTYANKLSSNLTNALNNLNSSNDYLKRYFTINDKTVDGGKVDKTKLEINDIIKKLNKTIIPNINNNIRSLTNKINSLTNEINNLKRELNSVMNQSEITNF